MKTYEDASGNTVTWVGWTWADTAQQLLIRTQGGEQLDLAQADIGIFNTIAAAGVLADWNEILGEDYLKENFEQSALDVGNIDGKQLGLPWSMASITMVYNPEILAAAGWDTVPTTIEEFEQCMADIKAYNPDIIPYAVSTKDATCAGDFMPWLWTFGGAIFNEDGTVKTDVGVLLKVKQISCYGNDSYGGMSGRGDHRCHRRHHRPDDPALDFPVDGRCLHLHLPARRSPCRHHVLLGAQEGDCDGDSVLRHQEADRRLVLSPRQVRLLRAFRSGAHLRRCVGRHRLIYQIQ